MLRLIGALLLVVPSSALSQSFITISAQQCVFHAGENSAPSTSGSSAPDWSSPGFDDSGWQPISQWPAQQSSEPDFWLRCRFHPAQLAPAIQPVLQVSGDFSYQLFLNGGLLGTSGDLLTGRHTAGLVHQYSAPELTHISDRSPPILVAVHLTYYPTNYDLQPLPELTLGPSSVLRDQHTARVARAVAIKSVIWLSYIVIAGAGLFFLALYLFDRSQVMILWVSLTWLSLALIRLSEFLVTASIPTPSVFEYLCCAIGNTNGIASILFFFALTARPVPRFFRIIAILSLASTAPLILIPFFPAPSSHGYPLVPGRFPSVLFTGHLRNLPVVPRALFAFWPLSKIPRGQLPIFLASVFWMLINFLYMGMQFPGLPLAASDYLKLQPIRSFAMALVAVVMTILLIQRIRATNRQRAFFAGELQAAREIQQLLVPAHIDSAPWLRLYAAFLPAREVGGDFYRAACSPTALSGSSSAMSAAKAPPPP